MAAAVLSWRSCASETPAPIALKIHARLSRCDSNVLGTIYLPHTMSLVQIGDPGTVLRSCPWCPREDGLRPEIEFVLAQRPLLESLRNGSRELSAHITYEFALDGRSCSHTVKHTNDDCEPTYESSGDGADEGGGCDPRLERVGDAGVQNFSRLCSSLSEKWTSVYRKLQDAHQVENVYALFWEGSNNNSSNYTACVLRSPAPFINNITLSGPGLIDVPGPTDEADNGTVSEVHNQTHPNVSCHVRSPTGWSVLITRIREPDEKIFFGKRSSGPDDGTEAADIATVLFIVIGTFLVIFSGVCWAKRRDIIESMVEMHDWSRNRRRRRYARVSW